MTLKGIMIAGLVAGGLTVFSGVMHGRLSQRWGPRPEMELVASKLTALPTEIGPWKSAGDTPLEPVVVQILDLTGYVSRQYVNETTGERVTVAILLGPGGPISVHTPEICYNAQAYDIISDREAITVGQLEPQDQLWRRNFVSRGVDQHKLSVFYGWSTGAEFAAVRNTRWTLTREPFLYKLQLAATFLTEEQADVGVRFLEAFLPAVRDHLVTREAALQLTPTPASS